MAKGFIGEVLHFNAVRLRVIGSGSLLQSLHSLDNESSVQLSSVTMAASTGIEPTSITSFVSQRAYLELRVVDINEYFSISKIIVFVKPTASGYPL